jgi:hypothetical protein
MAWQAVFLRDEGERVVSYHAGDRAHTDPFWESLGNLQSGIRRTEWDGADGAHSVTWHYGIRSNSVDDLRLIPNPGVRATVYWMYQRGVPLRAEVAAGQRSRAVVVMRRGVGAGHPRCDEGEPDGVWERRRVTMDSIVASIYRSFDSDL